MYPFSFFHNKKRDSLSDKWFNFITIVEKGDAVFTKVKTSFNPKDLYKMLSFWHQCWCCFLFIKNKIKSFIPKERKKDIIYRIHHITSPKGKGGRGRFELRTSISWDMVPSQFCCPIGLLIQLFLATKIKN